jgi:hypothetical protein
MKKKIRIEKDFFGNITRYEETRSNSMFDNIFDDDEEVIVVDRLGRLRSVAVNADDESGEVAVAAFIGSAVGSLLGSLLGSNKKKAK